MNLISNECRLIALPAQDGVFQRRHCNDARLNLIPAAKPNMAAA